MTDQERTSICVAVLNYNGVHHLEHLLPSLERAQNGTKYPISLLVLDNGSTAGDESWVQNRFPRVRFVCAPGNDYLFSYNWLCQRVEEDIVVFLNNDMRVEEDFIDPLISHFEDRRVFAVGCRLNNWSDGAPQNGPAELSEHRGYWRWPFGAARQEPSYTAFCGGGSAAFRRSTFLELGGFDRLFYPAYCEDVDLCVRAWDAGYRCIYEPRSVIRHRELGTGTIGEKGRLLDQQARFLWHWKNLPKQHLLRANLYFSWLTFVRYRRVPFWQSTIRSAARLWREAGKPRRPVRGETLNRLKVIAGKSIHEELA